MKKDKIEQLFSDFIGIVSDVPFGNSDWQNRHAIVNEELTPYRAYRQSALRIVNRFNSLREAYYGLKEKEIELEEKQELLDRPWWKLGAIRSDYERKRITIKLERIRGDMPWIKKLISDAVKEINCLLPVINAIGPLSKLEFESQEHKHFELKLKRKIPELGDDLYSLLTDKDGANLEFFDMALTTSQFIENTDFKKRRIN